MLQRSLSVSIYVGALSVVLDVVKAARVTQHVQDTNLNDDIASQPGVGSTAMLQQLANDETAGTCCLYTFKKNFEYRTGACYASHVRAAFDRKSCKILKQMDPCNKEELASLSAEQCYAALLAGVEARDEKEKGVEMTAMLQQTAEDETAGTCCLYSWKKNFEYRTGACHAKHVRAAFDRKSCNILKQMDPCNKEELATLSVEQCYAALLAGVNARDEKEKGVEMTAMLQQTAEDEASGTCCFFTAEKTFEYKSGYCAYFAKYKTMPLDQQQCQVLTRLNPCNTNMMGLLSILPAEMCFEQVLKTTKALKEKQADVETTAMLQQTAQAESAGTCCLYTWKKNFEYKFGACKASHVRTAFNRQDCNTLKDMDPCNKPELASLSAQHCYSALAQKWR